MSIALIIGTIATLRVNGTPHGTDAWWQWVARVAAALWITFGGHYVELFYLHRVLPRVLSRGGAVGASGWLVRLVVRCAVWAVGGAVLWICGVATYGLIMGGGMPSARDLPAIAAQGAAGFIVIELLGVHVILTIIGYPSIWRSRNGRWG
ncbi:MAG: hypothetical protein WC718_03765 [Phycisphaerales bacterium]